MEYCGDRICGEFQTNNIYVTFVLIKVLSHDIN